LPDKVEQEAGLADKTIDPAGIILLAMRRWRLLTVICGISAVVAALVNFMVLPKWYKARTIIMPPQESSGFSGLGMLLSSASSLPGGLGRLASSVGSLNSSQFLFVVVLNSRTLADSLIEKYDLDKVYKTKYRFKTRSQLRGHTVIDFPPEGHIVVTVESKDPQLACDLTNEYVIQLNRILMDKEVFSAIRKRKFLENRLEETKANLITLEDSLRRFQEKHGIIQPEEEARGVAGLITGPIQSTIAMLGLLQAERESKMIQLRTMRSIYTARHPSVNLLKTEVDELDRTITKIKGTLTDETSLDESGLLIPVSDLPEIALSFTRLYRAVKIQEEMFLLLSAQYEEARINELDDMPGAVVLDPAVVPEYKYRPKRLLNILISTGAVFIICMTCLIVFCGIPRDENSGVADEGFPSERA
jgi:uncharacterized protein involved in exopolysaccharide biosynthesis